jgi:long-chain acyl-CoA synthetase
MKLPTRIDVVPALPRNAVGKIDKPALRRGLPPAG